MQSTVYTVRELFYDDGYVRLSGFIATEQAARSNRNAQSFFINARYIKSQKLSFALQRAYDMRLMVGKFPFAVLNLAISPNEIDVNVHPNKLDVRFKNEERVMRAATIAACQFRARRVEVGRRQNSVDRPNMCAKRRIGRRYHPLRHMRLIQKRNALRKRHLLRLTHPRSLLSPPYFESLNQLP